MTLSVVPFNAVPAQVTNVNLDQQACTIKVYQKFFGMFMDLYVDNVLIVGGVLCLTGTRIVQSLYLGFSGDFAWIDTQGDLNPYYTGIGSRYFLAYIPASDLPPGVG